MRSVSRPCPAYGSVHVCQSLNGCMMAEQISPLFQPLCYFIFYNKAPGPQKRIIINHQMFFVLALSPMFSQSSLVDKALNPAESAKETGIL